MPKVTRYYEKWEEYQDELCDELEETKCKPPIRKQVKDPDRDIRKGRKWNKRRFRPVPME